ncbi:MAG: glycosyl hydrolase-related protein [Cytophagales bacterium]|nr:glycosyl hydrolase-related protein [Cytophagales bacterium]
MDKVRIKDKMRSAYSPQQWLLVQIERIQALRFEQSIPIENWEIKEAIYHGPGNYEWLSEDWSAYRNSEVWGGENHTAFFRCVLQIPEQFDGKYGVLRLKPGGEGLLRINEKPFAGLDSKHTTIFLDEKLKSGSTYRLQIEQTVNEMEVPVNLHRFELTELAVLNREVENAYYDFRCLYDIVATNQAASDVVQFLFNELKKAVALVDFESGSDNFRESLKEAVSYLKQHVYESGRYKIEGRLNMIGHSHLDLVYQWDYKEFQRKIGRTHSTTLNVMREFPEYLFCQSQLKLYEDLKELYPEIYEGIKQKVKDNRWEVIGGMYVEPDCNLISGESFIRQLYHGHKIAKDEFGTASSVCWLPDVFGISWFIPQILKRTGYKYLITNKPVIWNDTNEMPANSFWWEGPDGSKIFVHLPATHFGAKIDADIMLTNWNEYKQKIACSEAIYNYGYADGRGGPNRADILKGMRYKHTPGVPESAFTHGQEAFERMEQKTTKLSVLKNELYLETHRGTYTTQARLKKNNRKAEVLYKNAELASVFAYLSGDQGGNGTLVQGWKLILKNQFHDILPGSHVNQAYHDAMKEYKKVFQVGKDTLESSIDFILDKDQVESNTDDSIVLAIFNFQPWERNNYVEVKIKIPFAGPFKILDPSGNELEYQIIHQNNRVFELLVYAQKIPSVGYSTIKIIKGTPAEKQPNEVDEGKIENSFYRLQFDEEGDIAELYDKTNERYIVEQGSKANEFQLFEDVPGKYAAWDIVPMYKENEFDISGVESSRIIEHGPARIVIRQERSFGKSSICQNIILYNHSPQIDFETEIDWQERDRLLKVAFPVAINAMQATYDISYGYIERPTHQNTTWDAAKFEVCGHMWADLSEGDYGVSILNDCKYGYDILENVIRLTLLKGPRYPDPKADLGKHAFTYSLCPHKGGWREAQIPRRSWELNDKLLPIALNSGNNLPSSGNSFMNIDKDHVLLSAVKRSEDGKGVIIRLYEDQNRRGIVNITFMHDIIRAFECDPFEKEIEEVELVGGDLQFSIKPFEVRTFKLIF